jgi:protein O-GlcNAc transferase
MMRAPTARLVLKDKAFRPKRIRALALEQLGLPAERVTFRDQTPHVLHLKAHDDIDVGLDPFDANGGVSSLDALWMGVPVLTKIGALASGRVGASLMSTLAMPQFVTQTTEEYVAKAVALAGDISALAAVRTNLRKHMTDTTLGNGPLFVAHMESLYRQMWQAYCRKEAA